VIIMQEFIVFLIVLAAVVYLARQYWPSKSKSGGCGGCSSGGCGKESTAPRSSTLPRSSTPAGESGLIQINVNGAQRKKL